MTPTRLIDGQIARAEAAHARALARVNGDLSDPSVKEAQHALDSLADELRWGHLRRPR